MNVVVELMVFSTVGPAVAVGEVTLLLFGEGDASAPLATSAGRRCGSPGYSGSALR